MSQTLVLSTLVFTLGLTFSLSTLSFADCGSCKRQCGVETRRGVGGCGR
ncbi:MAG: hypothetical protein ACTHJ4_01810 [Candidatus Nucleicultricaceae bacterium]